MSTVNKAKCHTKIDIEDYIFTWTIENSKLIPWAKEKYLESQIFSTKCGEEFFFRLAQEWADEKLVKRLYLLSKNLVSQFYCNIKVSVIVNEEKSKDFLERYTDFNANKDNTILLIEKLWSDPIFCSLGTTTINCRLTLVLDPESIYNIKEKKLKLNFDWIFLDKKFSDVVLRTACGKEIPAHRLMLATASPVFKAMFSHDMLENKSQSVDIIDVSYETAVELLRYIYTGGVETREVSLVIDLLAAADKYQVNELKNLCEELLNSNLSTENALEILKVADKYDIKSLKKIAADFIKLHIIGPSNSDDLGDMILSMEQFFSKKFSS